MKSSFASDCKIRFLVNCLSQDVFMIPFKQVMFHEMGNISSDTRPWQNANFDNLLSCGHLSEGFDEGESGRKCLQNVDVL